MGGTGGKRWWQHPRRWAALVVILTGFFVRGSVSTVPRTGVMVTALPRAIESNTPAPSWTAQIIATAPPVTQMPAPATASPSPSPTPVVPPHAHQPATAQIEPTATPTPTVSPTLPPDAQPPVPTPPPGYSPDYAYQTDDLRIAITRHEDDGVVYFAVELWLTDIHQLRSAFSSDAFDAATEPVSDIAARADAILAINGDFATFNNGGIIIRNGDVYRTNHSTRQLLVIDGNGDFIPYQVPPGDPEAAASGFHMLGVWHTLVFGPVLVENGQPVDLPKKFFVSTGASLEPRTAIAQLGPLHYLILVVDGRQEGYSKGVSLGRLQEMFVEYGAITAFNLDGGGSSTLYYDGKVLNQPGNGGQRHVPDILYIPRPQ